VEETEAETGPDPDLVAEAAEALADEHGSVAEVMGRMIRLRDPVKGDPGLSALRVLGVAQAASPVGVAVHGVEGVASGVWAAPDLYLCRWTPRNRWVVGFRIPKGAKPSDYIRSEGRIPSRFETGNWYSTVPESAQAAFEEVGLSVDDAPFPVPAAPERPPVPEPTARRGAERRPPGAAKPPRPATPRAPRAAKTPAPPKPEQVAVRLCPGCGFQKSLVQFVADSEYCVDCR
jgi:hypothetical protein